MGDEPKNKGKDEVSVCPTCKEQGEFLLPPKVKGRILVATFKCQNGHTYSKELILK